MVNRERGELALVVRGDVYTLRLTLEACVEVEARAGQPLDRLTDQAGQGRVKAIRWLLWASLQAGHASAFKTPQTIGDLIDRMGGIAKAVDVVSALVLLNADDSDDLTPQKIQRPPRQKPTDRWREAYVTARQIGMDPDRFWALSLREWWRELAAHRAQQRHEYDRDITLAWNIAALVWQNKLPALKTLLARQSADTSDLLTQLYAIGDLYGLKVRQVNKVH